MQSSAKGYFFSDMWIDGFNNDRDKTNFIWLITKNFKQITNNSSQNEINKYNEKNK